MSNIYQVAELAGVSPKTAARILAGESPRSKSREKVFEAAQSLGYVRNQQAANLRSGNTSVIGIVVPDIVNPFYSMVLHTMHDACLEQGLSILLASSFGKPDEEVRALRTLQSYRVDGVLLNASEHPISDDGLSICEQFIDQGKPVVLAGEVKHKLRGADRVHIRNEAAVIKAVRYLVSKGHRRIGFIGGARDNPAMQQRHSGYMLGLKEAGLESPKRYSAFGGDNTENIASCVSELIIGCSAKTRPTALVAGNDIIAIHAMKAIQQLSLSIPDDIAIIGFDGIALGNLITPSLTTLKQPQVEIARDIVHLIESRIRSKSSRSGKRLDYEPELFIGGSA